MSELPEGWTPVTLGKISELKYGKSLPAKKRSGSGYPVYGSNGIVGYHDEALTDGPTIIVGRKGSFGEINYSKSPCSPIDTTYYIDQFDACSADFQRRLLLTLGLTELNRSSAIPGLNRDDAYACKFALPPSNEQKRIVDKLEKCEARIDAAKAALDDVPQLLEHYRQSVLAAAFRGDLTRDWRTAHPDAEPAEQLLERLRDERRQRWEQAELEKYEAKGKAPPKNWKQKYKSPQPLTEAQLNELPELPKGWCWAKSEEISTRVTVGHVGSMKNEYRSEGVPFLRGQNVRENRFDANGLLYVSEGFHKKLSKSTLAPGDIVVTRSGDVGTACVIPKSLGEANCSDLVIIQEPLSIVPQVIAYFINSSGKAMINKGKVGVAITHFNTKSVAEMPLPIPPLEEQRCILTKLDQLTNRCSEISSIQSQNVSALKTATQSLLSKAFRGELVPQDPNDEPASKLLERIAEARKQAKPTPRKPARKQAQVI